MYQSSLRKKRLSDARIIDEEKPYNRLFLVKGRRHIRVIQVECSAKSLNEDDAFVLDAQDSIFVWFGLYTNRIEKGKAAKFATRYKNQEKKGIPSVIYIDSDSDRTRSDFWFALSEKGSLQCETQTAVSDLVFEKELMDTFILYEILKMEADGDDHDSYSTRKIERQGSLYSRDLERHSQKVYLLDCVSEIYVWEAKNSVKLARRFAEEYAEQLKASRHPWVIYAVVYEDEEPILFREKFADWPEFHFHAAEKQAHYLQSKRQFDVNTMLESSFTTSPIRKPDASWYDNHMPITIDNVDDGKGHVTIWIVENYKLRELNDFDTSLYGQFYASESYVISYIWEYYKKTRCMLYFWLGRTCDSVSGLLSSSLEGDSSNKMVIIILFIISL
jgi:hypothetical protein